jgi:hypothetical protein
MTGATEVEEGTEDGIELVASDEGALLVVVPHPASPNVNKRAAAVRAVVSFFM